MLKFLIVFGLITTLNSAYAELRVMTTTSTLASLVKEIGRDKVQVKSIARGSQDPHYIEAKPSYMVKLRNADLIISVGLELEIGWLSSVLRGARNPSLLEGREGFLNASKFITPLEIPKGKVDRSQGDIHSEGNPHYLLDPLRAIEVSKGIMLKLGELDSQNKAFYQKNWEGFSQKLRQQYANWKNRIQTSKIKKVITHHRTLTYFLNTFGLSLWNSIESKPGIPPSARHIISIIKNIKTEKKGCILVESFFETNVAKRIANSSPAVIQIVPTEVDSLPETKNYHQMIEKLVTAIENCSKS